MSFRGHIEDFFFFHEIGVDELDENKAKRNQSKPDGPTGKHRAQKCGEHAAGHKDAQHADMQPRPLGERLVFRMLEGFDDMDAELADVVGAKGRRHRNASRLAKRVVLHRAQHVDRNLGDLERRAVRHEAQQGDRHDFQTDQDRVPAQPVMFFDRGGERLGNNGSKQVGAHRHEVVHGFHEVGAAQRHGEQHKVGGLRVAKHAPANRIRVGAVKAADEHQQKEHVSLFAFQILEFAFLGFLDLFFGELVDELFLNFLFHLFLKLIHTPPIILGNEKKWTESL